MSIHKKRFGLAIGTVLLAAAPLTFVHADHDENRGCVKQDSAAIPFVETEATGSATLCLRPRGLKGHLRLKGLIPGNAYTVWWVYIDDPSSCSGGPGVCGVPDFFGDKPLAVMGRFSSGVAPRRGRLGFWGSLNGLEPTSGSQVWFFTWGHGAASDDGAALARQLLTPEDPNAGIPHLGNAVDGQLGYPVSNAVFTVE